MEKQNKNWAAEYILDPLNAPDPSAETGPGSSFRQRDPDEGYGDGKRVLNQSTGGSTKQVPNQSTGGSTNPFRRNTPISSVATDWTGQSRSTSDSLPPYGHARKSRGYRNEAFGTAAEKPQRSQSAREKQPVVSGRPRRASSLSQRYPGDPTANPLKMIERENKLANRSPHLRKHHQPRADTIDRLDRSVVGAYHHSGPYDATLLVRNTSYDNSPLAAVTNTNREALKATPKAKVNDSLEQHRPLEGTAIYPPGMQDPLGNVLYYDEGDNMMTAAGGDYKRWPGITYHPDDIKGKGEPSYTIEKHLKEHSRHNYRDTETTFELTERPKHPSTTASAASGDNDLVDLDANGGPANSKIHNGDHQRSISGELKRRIGSMKRNKRES